MNGRAKRNCGKRAGWIVLLPLALWGCSSPEPGVAPPASDEKPLVKVRHADVGEIAAPPPVSTGPAMASEVRTDEKGLVTLLEGPSPQSVLRSFAEQWPTDAGPMEIVGIEDGPFVSGQYARAVYVTSGADGQPTRYAFVVRYDPDKGTWVAGDGSGPIQSIRVP